MIPMTFRGMKMLHRLEGFKVPMPGQSAPLSGKTALEVMPGAALQALGLPDRGYKSGPNRREKREEILRGLLGCPPIRVSGLECFRRLCIEIDDCLDAVIAAIVGAMWLHDSTLFCSPPSEGEDGYSKVLLEGWLYSPRHSHPC